MAAILKNIKVIQKDFSDRIQMLNSYIFGDKEILNYNENYIYNLGDFIKKINNETGEYEILQCNENNVTGAFNPLKWQKNNVSSLVSGETVNNKIIQLSESQPLEPNNILWYQIKNIKDIGEIDVDGDCLVIISTNDQVVGQYDAPEGDVALWFDYE